MQKILLINGGKAFGESGGHLNRTLQELARQTLQGMGYEIQETHIDEGYTVEAELEKICWADVWIYQMPGWWMGVPWFVKKYFDEVLGAGVGVLFASDGRSSAQPKKNYGRGGLAQAKRYMLSVTWNAPLEAFTDPEEFFGGAGVDAVYLSVHKTHEFLGMRPLPTFMCNDVVKDPQVEDFIKNYRAHLHRVFAR